MKILIDLIFLTTTFIALIKSVDIFIKSTTKIAHHFKISGYTISFFLVAVATSLPEILVAFTSGIRQNPILSFGNAMGSNIALLTLVIAIPIIAGSSISTRKIIASKDVYFMIFFSVLPITMGTDGILSRIDGVVLILSYVVYMSYMLRPARGVESLIDDLGNVDLKKQIVLFCGSLIILLLASQIIVGAAFDLSSRTAIGLGLIGLSITAVGTSLPEIAYTIGNARHGKSEEILGDILGSVVANSTLVLGITAVTYPIQLGSSKIGISSFYFYMLILLIFVRFARTKERLNKVEAFVLLALYIAFLATEVFLQTNS